MHALLELKLKEVLNEGNPEAYAQYRRQRQFVASQLMERNMHTAHRVMLHLDGHLETVLKKLYAVEGALDECVERALCAEE